MAGKFVEPEEAAQMLGVTLDQLGEMRDRREVYPIRDGGVWKYRRDDIERLVEERAGGLDDFAAEFSSSEDQQDSILLSEKELGESGGTSSTVIGKTGEGANPESDLQLPGSSSSAISLGGSSILPKSGSSKSGMTSDVRLASASDLQKAGSGLSAKFEEMDALDLELPTPAESGLDLVKPSSGSSKKNKGDDLLMGDDDFALGGESGIKPGSSKKMTGSGLDLGADDDDDFVLGGSGKGSDITHRAGDSGIQLISPADSGLSLEEAPMDLGGSGVESLELGDDDMILLDEGGESESATQLKSDDDFLLTPLDDAAGDESDSGSQVIALDSEVDFDDAASTMLGSRQPAMAAMLEEDMGGMDSPLVAETGFGQPAFAGAPAFVAAPQAIEAPFSAANIVFLFLCVFLLAFAGMMTYDLARHIWSWDSPYSVNSSLMDFIINMFAK